MDTWVSKVNLIFFFSYETMLRREQQQNSILTLPSTVEVFTFLLSLVIDHFKIPLKAMDPLSE